MSLVGAFIAAVTGVDAQATKLGAVSDNIANANTVGYKPTDVLFKTLVVQRSIPTNYAPGGVIPTPEARMDLQGLLTSSSSTTDIAISGNGFFPVVHSTSVGTTGTIAQGSDRLVTRAGSFTLDKNGFLQNSAGYDLLGVPSGSALPTSLTGLQAVKLTTTTIAGSATTNVSISANLPATATAGSTQTMTVGAFDSSGNSYALGLTFTNTGTNSWSAALTSVAPTDPTTGITGTVASAPVALNFNSLGQLSTATSTTLGTVTLSNGQTLSPTFNLGGGGVAGVATGGLTQFGSSFAASDVQENGKGAGFRTGVTVGSDGTVSEVYSNGLTIPRFQVPVVTFPNPQGLEAVSGNAWLATGGTTTASGTATLSVSNTGGAGQIMPSELEQSAVDLSTEFENMIISQSTYQANTKTITTADQMYQTIAQLR